MPMTGSVRIPYEKRPFENQNVRPTARCDDDPLSPHRARSEMPPIVVDDVPSAAAHDARPSRAALA